MKALIILLALAACGGDDSTFTVEQLQDPDTCKTCHPKHYAQWESSMHAYSSDDPVFIALNKRGQRETNNALGDFCVKCHAPMAVNLGVTNGVDYDATKLTGATRGVTCYFCHNVKEITDTHNNPLVLANDTTMRGGAKNPATNSAHHGLYDETMDSDINDSKMCGACHDLTNQQGVPLERTFADWQTTFFSSPTPTQHLSCGSCHMKSSKDVIADDPNATVGVRTNGFHQHLWQGVDVALTTWPGQDTLKAANQADLDATLSIVGISPIGGFPGGGICVKPTAFPTGISVRMDAVNTGHTWPSGATHDRRAWLELRVYDGSGNELTQYSKNVVADGTDPVEIPNATFWDRTYTDAAKSTRAHFFWDVAAEDISLLKQPVTLDKNSPMFDHSTTYGFNLPGTDVDNVDRVEARILIRPFPFEMLNLLVASGDLDPALLAKVPTYELAGSKRTWTKATQGVDRCSPAP